MSNQSPYTAQTDPESDDRLWALLSYIVPVIIPLVILLTESRKNRPLQKFHAVQSLVFAGISIITGFLVIGACLGPLLYIYGIVIGIKVYQGGDLPVPYISDFIRKQNWA